MDISKEELERIKKDSISKYSPRPTWHDDYDVNPERLGYVAGATHEHLHMKEETESWKTAVIAQEIEIAGLKKQIEENDKEIESLRTIISDFDNSNDKYAVQALREENERLREVAKKAMQYIQASYGFIEDNPMKEIIQEIDTLISK